MDKKSKQNKNPDILVNDDEFAEIMKEVREIEEKFKKPANFSTKYQHSYVNMEKVVNNPEEYIIPELQAACKKLWSINIFTFMCSNREDGGHSYILLEKLSAENQAIFEKLRKEHPKNFIFNEFRRRFGIDFKTENMTEKEIAEIFDNAISYFKPQDIQIPFYETREQFLFNCGCYSEIPNPKYVEDPGPMPGNLKALDEWFAKQQKTLKVFDENKVTKPMGEYLKEKAITTYDPETQRIYQSEYFFQKHLDFIKKSAHAEEERSL